VTPVDAADRARVVAVLLTHQARDRVEHVLSCIGEQDRRPERVVVIDNASADGTPEVAVRAGRRLGLPVEVTVLDVNLGVGGGHNLGWRTALADGAATHLWVLEHDDYPRPACLRELLTAAGDREVVAVPRLARDDRELADSLEADAAGSRSWPAFAADGSVARQTFTLNGTLLPRSVLERVGLLREDLFVGQEDWDYSQRVRSAGIVVHHCPDAHLLHPTKGDHRYGVRPSVLRSYYSHRNVVFLRSRPEGRAHLGAAAVQTAWSVASLGRILLRDDHKVRRVAARAAATVDGLLGRMGSRAYWFMSGGASRRESAGHILAGPATGRS
jgi:GT2 family glycosyltransferase